MRLKAKTALISGAGRNNGRAIALAFAREGADLILVARQSGEDLNQVAKQCESFGVQTLPLLADVGRPEEVNRVVQQGLARFGKVDISVSVAGLRPHKNVWEYDYDEWQKVFAVNVHSTFYLAKALAPHMMERKSGNFVALGSIVSMTAIPSAALEVSCKHSLYGLIKSLALELGPYGVRANLVALANIQNERRDIGWYQVRNLDGEIARTGSGGDPLTTDAERKRRSPLGRMGTRQEVANAVLFLASDESSYVTGDRLVCAGGIYM